MHRYGLDMAMRSFRHDFIDSVVWEGHQKKLRTADRYMYIHFSDDISNDASINFGDIGE